MSKKTTILLVDDEPIIRKSLKMSLEPNFKVLEAQDYDSAVDAFQRNDVDLTILDINYNSKKDGIDLLKSIKNIDASAPVMMLSSVTEIPKVVESIRHGAYDYITKGTNSLSDEVMFRVRNCLNRIIERRSLEGVHQSFKEKYTIISNNKKIHSIMNEIAKVGDMNIMIEGETGVGKTPIARYANMSMSKNGERPFVRINCAGLSRERLQDELFGHKKGSYTGADSDKKGLVEIAKDGDLFLDEVADLNMECQAELLTFLDSGEYRRLGDPTTRYTNCRIISAANYSLKDRVAKGIFRKDLYSRLAQCKVNIPPLRERKEDIKPIVEFYIKQYAGCDKPYDREIIDLYNKYDWAEGNVRELRDAVKYMCQKSKEMDKITLDCINSEYFSKEANVSNLCGGNILGEVENEVVESGLEGYMSGFEHKILQHMSQKTDSVKDLAEKLKINDVTLYRKLKKYNIKL